MSSISRTATPWTSMPDLKTWVVRVWLLSCFAIVLGSSWVVDWLAPAPQSHPSVHWLETRFTWLEPALPDVAANATVKLPDNWKSRGLPPHGLGRYTTTVKLTDAGALRPDTPWALRVDHLCSEHRISLNGDLLVTTQPEVHMRGKMIPVMVDIPTRLLNPGTNTVSLDVSCLVQGGLSPLVLAPQKDLKGTFANRELFTIMIPLAMNVAGLAFGLFLLMLWWFRDENRIIGLMGVVTLVASVRNCSYYVLLDVAIGPNLLSWLHFTAHTVVGAVFGLFALAYTHSQWHAYRRTLQAVLLGFPIIGLVALPFDQQLFFVRGSLQLLLMLLCLPSLWILFRASRQWRMVSTMAFTMGALAMVAATLRDYVMIRVIGDPTALYWTAVCFPLALPGLYLVMAERFTKALDDVERANMTLEQRVQERTADLAAANSAKSDFLAAASHDLRQPMVAIGLISGLLRDRISEPELQALTGRLCEAVESMENLLSRLLDLSRLEAGAVELNPQRVALQPLFDAIVAHEAATAQAKGLQISMRAPHAAVWCDPVLLEQVLRNLVGNAVRYTHQGRILVCARRRGPEWLIQVWDTGIGIAPQDQRRIFDDFVQLDNPGRNLHGGLGLGLALVQRAARLMGTQVVVHSRVGQGSCFSIRLPLAGQPRAAAAPSPAIALPLSGTPLQGLNILLLEDDRAVRLALDRRLQAWGARVVSMASLAELRLVLGEFQAGRGQRPDMLLTDLTLGDGNGLQAKDEAAKVWPALPTTIITGDTAPAQLQALADCGAPVLHKPFRPEDLLRTLLSQR